MREGLGEEEGDAEPNLAKRAARLFEGGVVIEAGEFEGVMEAVCAVSRLTLDFLSALRRARRASSIEFEEGIVRHGGSFWNEGISL